MRTMHDQRACTEFERRSAAEQLESQRTPCCTGGVGDAGTFSESDRETAVPMSGRIPPPSPVLDDVASVARSVVSHAVDVGEMRSSVSSSETAVPMTAGSVGSCLTAPSSSRRRHRLGTPGSSCYSRDLQVVANHLARDAVDVGELCLSANTQVGTPLTVDGVPGQLAPLSRESQQCSVCAAGSSHGAEELDGMARGVAGDSVDVGELLSLMSPTETAVSLAAVTVDQEHKLWSRESTAQTAELATVSEIERRPSRERPWSPASGAPSAVSRSNGRVRPGFCVYSLDGSSQSERLSGEVSSCSDRTLSVAPSCAKSSGTLLPSETEPLAPQTVDVEPQMPVHAADSMAETALEVMSPGGERHLPLLTTSRGSASSSERANRRPDESSRRPRLRLLFSEDCSDRVSPSGRKVRFDPLSDKRSWDRRSPRNQSPYMSILSGSSHPRRTPSPTLRKTPSPSSCCRQTCLCPVEPITALSLDTATAPRPCAVTHGHRRVSSSRQEVATVAELLASLPPLELEDVVKWRKRVNSSVLHMARSCAVPGPLVSRGAAGA